MPKGLRRRRGQRHLHFITCSCYRRLALFASARAKNLFVKILGEVRDRHGFAFAGIGFLVAGGSNRQAEACPTGGSVRRGSLAEVAHGVDRGAVDADFVMDMGAG